MANATPKLRDARIDVFRGLALLVIFINHIPGNALTPLTFWNFGFSDAAQIFVFLSGWSAARAYSSAHGPGGSDMRYSVARIYHRVWELYAAHLVLFIAVAGLVAVAEGRLGRPGYMAALDLATFFGDTVTALLDALTLSYLPHTLDILPLYIVLMAALPLFLWMVRFSPWLALLVSFGLYAATQFIDMNLLANDQGRTWFFNPFAWQFLFAVGVVAGHLSRTHGRLVPRSSLLLGLCSAYLAYALLAAAPWQAFGVLLDVRIIPEHLIPSTGKQTLEPARLLHGLALFYVASHLVSPQAEWLSRLPMRMMACCGQQSLPIFGLGILSSLTGRFLLDEFGRGSLMQLAVNGGGIALLIASAYLLNWYEQQSRAYRSAPAHSIPSGLQAA